jgi:hypothetical protein
MVAETYVRAEGAFPLVGVGGIDSGGAALTRIRAGASLIQLYSSLIYKGLGLVEAIKTDLASTLLPPAATRSRKSSARMPPPSPEDGRFIEAPVTVCSAAAALAARDGSSRFAPACG